MRIVFLCDKNLKLLLIVSVNLTPYSATTQLSSLTPTPTPGSGPFSFSNYWYKHPSFPSHKRLALLIQTSTIFHKGLSGPCIQHILSDLQYQLVRWSKMKSLLNVLSLVNYYILRLQYLFSNRLLSFYKYWEIFFINHF